MEDDSRSEVRERIAWVDIGKYICIMFVMLTHLKSGSDVLNKLYHPFFLTLFFFLSGYVYRQPASFGAHVKKKTRALLVPWFIFSYANLLMSMVVTLKKGRNFASEMLWNLVQVREHFDGLWFIAALFAAYIPFYFVIKWNKPGRACVLSAVLSLLSVLYSRLMPSDLFAWGSSNLPWHLEYIFQGMLWMVLGYYFKQHGEELFDRLNTGGNRLCIWAAYLFVIYMPNGLRGMAWEIMLSYVKTALGILAVISVSKVIKGGRYMRFVGANTLVFFALHAKIYTLIELSLELYAGAWYEACLRNAFTSSLLAVGITLVLSLILIVPAWIVNRWFPWVLGRKKPQVQSSGQARSSEIRHSE